MSTYTTYDFEESVPDMDAVASVVAAWGVDSDGWRGGFLLRLRDGTYSYVTGWCDYTGWGCRDGRYEERYATLPDIATLSETAGEPIGQGVGVWNDPIPPETWDHEPADLNLWLAGDRKSAFA